MVYSDLEQFRPKTAEVLEEWAKYLLDIGEDKVQRNETGEVEIPKAILAQSNCIKDFVSEKSFLDFFPRRNNKM